jgi:hypothetical protein
MGRVVNRIGKIVYSAILGNFIVKIVFVSGVLSTVIFPLCASTMALAIERPSPVP